MAETMTQTFNSLDLNTKRLYHKRNQPCVNLSSTYPSRDSIHLATTTSHDWHRLLIARLKPGITAKYQPTREKDNKSEGYSTNSFDGSDITLQSSTDDSYTIDERDVSLTQTDPSEEFSSLLDNSLRRASHYVKNFMPCRYADHITSLKRRVRKQQLKHFHNEVAILQETTLQVPSRSSLFLMSYCEPPRSLRRYKQKRSSCVVSLPLLTNPSMKTISSGVQDDNLSLYEC